MLKALDRGRVHGFLKAEGRRLLNGRGEEVLLCGWGLGNWLLCEGYMWELGDCPAFDRPRRMERVLEELCSARYAQRFWKRFREEYITEADIALMAEMGYNSLRVPLLARNLMSDSCAFREDGFQLLDRLMDWAEKYGLYVFLDMHGAPGGQTGANIDDSLDDRCRLLIDQAQYDRGLALWEEIARRYADRWIVGGYDLLNEPIRPSGPEEKSQDEYIPRLKEFYADAVARIRKWDQRHLVAIESPHWAAEPDFFDRRYDPNMVIHFHRYGCPPDYNALRPFQEAGERLNVPVWLGETGENSLTWVGAIVPLAFSMGISVTLWPWKKMGGNNSCCTIRRPMGWEKLREYLKGGAQPSAEEMQEVLDRFLDQLPPADCIQHPELVPQIFRQSGCVIRGTDFDALRGKDLAWHAESRHPAGIYRRETEMEIVPPEETERRDFPFDGPWARCRLRLHENEWVEYTVRDINTSMKLEVTCFAQDRTEIEITQDGRPLGSYSVSMCHYPQTLGGMHLFLGETVRIRVRCVRGTVMVDQLQVHPCPEYA